MATNILDDPGFIDALNKLLDEAQDVISAGTPEEQRAELGDLVKQAFVVGMAVATKATASTPTILDDLALNAVRYSGLMDIAAQWVNSELALRGNSGTGGNSTGILTPA